MHVDFKITTWERVDFDEEHYEDVLQAVKDGQINSADDLINFLLERGDNNFYRDKLTDVDEQMTPEENGGNATIEVFEFDSRKPIWDNSQIH